MLAAAVGTIIERMAIGVSDAAIQSAEVAADAYLQCVVYRLGAVGDVVDARSTDVGPEGIRRVAACNVEAGRHIAADRLAIDRRLGYVVGAQRNRSAVSRSRSADPADKDSRTETAA